MYLKFLEGFIAVLSMLCVPSWKFHKGVLCEIYFCNLHATFFVNVHACTPKFSKTARKPSRKIEHSNIKYCRKLGALDQMFVSDECFRKGHAALADECRIYGVWFKNITKDV